MDFHFQLDYLWEKYKFDFLTWFTRLQAGMAEGIIKTIMDIIIDLFNYFKAVSEKTNCNK